MKADYLIADIGATNARFVRIDSGQNPDAGPLAASAARVVLPTAKYSKAESLLDAAKDALGVAAPAACCLAIAGPVTAGVHTITNLGLEFDEHSLSERLGCPLHIVNDFHALAKAVGASRALLPMAKRVSYLVGGDGIVRFGVGVRRDHVVGCQFGQQVVETVVLELGFVGCDGVVRFGIVVRRDHVVGSQFGQQVVEAVVLAAVQIVLVHLTAGGVAELHAVDEDLEALGQGRFNEAATQLQALSDALEALIE